MVLEYKHDMLILYYCGQLNRILHNTMAKIISQHCETS